MWHSYSNNQATFQCIILMRVMLHVKKHEVHIGHCQPSTCSYYGLLMGLSNCFNIFLKIWSHLLKKSLMKNFIFCAVCYKSTLIASVNDSLRGAMQEKYILCYTCVSYLSKIFEDTKANISCGRFSSEKLVIYTENIFHQVTLILNN